MWEVCSIVILTLNMMNSDKIRSFAFMIWPSLQSSFIVFPPRHCLSQKRAITLHSHMAAMSNGLIPISRQLGEQCV